MMKSGLYRRSTRMAGCRMRASLPALAFSASIAGIGGQAHAADELNILSWCDLSDPAFLEPFEKAHDVRVNTKDYDSTNTAVTFLLNDPPGSWDVVSLDTPAVAGLVESNPGIFEPLNVDDFDWNNFYTPFSNPDDYLIDGELYNAPGKFGWNAISYNGANVNPDDLASFSSLWDGTISGTIAVFDFYSQQMQTIAMEMGLEPEDITKDDVLKIEEKLIEMKQNGVIVSDVVGVQTALATGESDIIFGGGEWASGALNAEVPEIDWLVPESGAVYYILGASLVGSSERKDLGRKFIKYTMSPEGQARLATSSCFWGLPVNNGSADHLSDDQKRFLRLEEQEAYLSRSHPTYYFDEEIDKAMLDSWARFLQQ